MKKSYIFLFAILSLVFLLVACGNKKYDEAMDNGSIAIENDEFEKAKAYYEEALEVKSQDEVAGTYLKQTKNMIDYMASFNNQEFEEAEEYLNNIIDEEQGLKNLNDKATVYLNELIKLKETQGEVEQFLAESQSAKEEGNYDEAKGRLDQIKKLELEHPFFKSLLERVSKVEEEIGFEMDFQKIVNQQYEQAKKLNSEENYNEALAIVREALRDDLNRPGFEELKYNLENLQSEIIAKQKAAEVAKKKQSIINGAKGYWENLDLQNHYCYFGDTSYVCATAETDEVYYEHILKWDADIEKSEALIHFKDGTVFNMPVGNNSITLYNGRYERTSKETLSDGRLGIDVDIFFDINRYNDGVQS